MVQMVQWFEDDRRIKIQVVNVPYNRNASPNRRMVKKKMLSPPITSWDSGVSALKDALKLEATVTKKIRDVIRVCEDATNYNDYHLVDYLTGDFLEEQYHGQRDIAGKVSNLEKLMASHGKLGEWLFDKKLQGLDIV
ncbi:ferritin subunit-like [Diorhabda sublineata]|uniref:ferritin subunit-like n=1 Tax=Diorhabda sublineata TaxID=1163346 RepID=UPI0024E0AEC9|nr:ferritin subunit-like [Diorhabda sublineata]